MGIGLVVGGGGGVRFVLNYEDNGSDEKLIWRRRAARLSALLCTESVGLLSASSSDHEDDMNGRDKDKDTAWEPA